MKKGLRISNPIGSGRNGYGPRGKGMLGAIPNLGRPFGQPSGLPSGLLHGQNVLGGLVTR
jgi:hypothetical protein